MRLTRFTRDVHLDYLRQVVAMPDGPERATAVRILTHFIEQATENAPGGTMTTYADHLAVLRTTLMERHAYRGHGPVWAECESCAVVRGAIEAMDGLVTGRIAPGRAAGFAPVTQADVVDRGVLRAAAADAKREQTAWASSVDTRLGTFDSLIAVLSANLARLDRQSSADLTRLETLSEAVTALTTRVADRSGDLDTLIGRVGDAVTRINDRIAYLVREIDRLSAWDVEGTVTNETTVTSEVGELTFDPGIPAKVVRKLVKRLRRLLEALEGGTLEQVDAAPILAECIERLTRRYPVVG